MPHGISKGASCAFGRVMNARTWARSSISALFVVSFLFGTSDASACGASAWVFDERQLPDCVESTSDSSDSYQWTNGCEDTLELTVVACDGECAVPAEIAAGATGALVFEENPEGPRVVEVQWTLGDESDIALIEYLYGTCPNVAQGGCSLVVARASS